jgi:uncharacterized membrane protein YeiH
MTGLKKSMDIFGVSILGLTTAVGGGVIRDIILGQTPPAVFYKPLYAIIAVCTSLFIFIPAVRRLLSRNQKKFEQMQLISDSIGLGIFTMAGIQAAFEGSSDYNIFLLIFVGVVTGVGGGVMRDVLAGNTPYIFVKHIYACASLSGAVLCSLLVNITGLTYAMAAGALVVIIIRLLAARYKWSLPKASVIT